MVFEVQRFFAIPRAAVIDDGSGGTAPDVLVASWFASITTLGYAGSEG